MAKITDSILNKIKELAQDIEYGQIVIKFNANSSNIDISVTKDIRILKDDEESTRPGRVVVRAVNRAN